MTPPDAQHPYKVLLYLRNTSNADLIEEQLESEFQIEVARQELPEQITADLVVVDAANLGRWQQYWSRQNGKPRQQPRVMLLLSRYVSRQAFESIPMSTYDDAIRIPTSRNELQQRVYRLLQNSVTEALPMEEGYSEAERDQLQRLNERLRHAFDSEDIVRIVRDTLCDMVVGCDGVQLALLKDKTDLTCYTMTTQSNEVDEYECPLLDAAEVYIRHHRLNRGKLLDTAESCEVIPDTAAGIITPLRHESELLGFLIVLTNKTDKAYDKSHVHLLDALADLLAHHVVRVNQYSRSRRKAVQEERERIARDLHDSVTQTLFSASMIAEAIPRQWEDAPPEVKDMLTDLHHMTRGALAETRMMLIELRPGAIQHSTFEELLRHLVQGMWSYRRIAMSLTLDAERILDDDTKVALYRIAQEAVNNALHHSAASSISVSYRANAERIELVIIDDGKGFDVDETQAGLGLRIMQERAQLIGADLTITSGGGGTTLMVKMESEKAIHD